MDVRNLDFNAKKEIQKLENIAHKRKNAKSAAKLFDNTYIYQGCLPLQGGSRQTRKENKRDN